jgi:hypothetical protein
MPDIQIQPISEENFYRTERYEDAEAGSITALIPVLRDGTLDLTRKPKFLGSTVVAGRLKFQFILDGPTLSKAVESWPLKLKEAIEQYQSDSTHALVSPDGSPLAKAN